MQPFRGLERGLSVSVSDSSVYEDLKDDLVRYATALVGPDVAADVVSTVVLRVISRRPLTDLKEPRPYLFRGVLNESRSVASRQHRESAASPREAVYDEPNERPEIIEAVLGLPVRQRAATYLVYWAGYTTAQTADLRGVGEGTVKRYLVLARTSLKGVLHARA